MNLIKQAITGCSKRTRTSFEKKNGGWSLSDAIRESSQIEREYALKPQRPAVRKCAWSLGDKVRMAADAEREHIVFGARWSSSLN